MDFEYKLSSIDLPKKFKRNEENCFLDPFRKKLIQITPEEMVRQKVAKYFIEVVKAPIKLVDTEVNLSHYKSDIRGRIDILIDKIEDNTRYPLAVIECKAKNIDLSAQTFKQASKYADAIGANYVFITNGCNILGWHYNEDKEDYEKITYIPNYEEMLSNQIEVEEYEPYQIQRTSLESLKEIDTLEEMITLGIIGEDTPNKLKGSIANLSECLMDLSHTFPKVERNVFKIIDDLGIKYLSYGDASGGSFGTGYYRTLLIEDINGNHRLVNLSIMATGKTIDHEKYGNSTGKSVLVVSLDDFDKDYMIVQINLNKFMTMRGESFKITHNGVVVMKNARSSELKNLVRDNNNSLVDGDTIIIGEVNCNELLYMDTPSLVNMIANLLEYCMIRDEYKRTVSIANKEKKNIKLSKIK